MPDEKKRQDGQQTDRPENTVYLRDLEEPREVSGMASHAEQEWTLHNRTGGSQDNIVR